jgi:ubiquinone/menaquinone biosynthesis C-methylase UbiE
MFDAVVAVLVLCTVDRPHRVLAEARRVLKPGGRMLLLEHVRADGPWGRFQDLTTPLHRFVSCGCAPNRRTAQAVRDAGFVLYEEPFPLHGASPLGRPAIQGIALKR